MSALEDIQQLLNRYTDGCNRQDWPQVMATFAEDGVWCAQGRDFTGHATIEAAMAGFLTGFDHFVQVNSPAVIDVAGDRAKARSTIRECGKFKGRDEALDVLGRYDDELVLTGQGWRFARRTFHAYGLNRFALINGPAFG